MTTTVCRNINCGLSELTDRHSLSDVVEAENTQQLVCFCDAQHFDRYVAGRVNLLQILLEINCCSEGHAGVISSGNAWQHHLHC